MTKENFGTLDIQKTFNQILSNIPPIVTDEYITCDLIPRMEQRRHRQTSLSRPEVTTKLFGTNPQKPGEVIEALQELFDSNFRLTPELATEIADICYYAHQPNCPDWLNNPDPFYAALQTTPEQALIFCALKYETRLQFGDHDKFKEIEFEVMREYLASIKS